MEDVNFQRLRDFDKFLGIFKEFIFREKGIKIGEVIVIANVASMASMARGCLSDTDMMLFMARAMGKL